MQAIDRRHGIIGVAASLSGTFLIFALVIGMNEFADSLNYDDRVRQTSFEVAPPPPKPEPEVEPEQQPEPEPIEAQAPPPLAELASDIGSVDIPVPGFNDNELNRAANETSTDKNMVMTDETVDTPPQATQQVAMQYPADAKRKGIEGYVSMSLLIDEQGQVRRVRVLESHPSGTFDEAAADAVRQWHFEPAKYKGENVRVWARQTIRFNLD